MSTALLEMTQTTTQQRFQDFCDDNYGIYSEEYFTEMLTFERKRSERSRRPFLLIKVNISGIRDPKSRHETAQGIIGAMSVLNRETDLKGWYRRGSVIGVILSETDILNAEMLRNKIHSRLRSTLSVVQMNAVHLSCHVFPDDTNTANACGPVDFTFYPDFLKKGHTRKSSLRIKRALDIVGSIAGIILFSPFLIIIPILMKLTMPGPILFRQPRVGQHGKHFPFLKFRSMHVNNDPEIHKKFVHDLIASGSGSGCTKGSGEKVFKIKNDKRITPLGSILRKTSMDELPQFFNVLFGDMSLAGPRPPIPYEIEKYDIWHRRRIMEVKPGITGLWQVVGRSSTTFDEMVRLDLEYARTWSLWLDIKILLKTPLAVVAGKGAY